MKKYLLIFFTFLILWLNRCLLYFRFFETEELVKAVFDRFVGLLSFYGDRQRNVKALMLMPFFDNKALFLNGVFMTKLKNLKNKNTASFVLSPPRLAVKEFENAFSYPLCFFYYSSI